MTVVEDVEADEGSGHCVREGCPANDGGACALGVDPVLDCEEYQLVGDEEDAGEPAAASNAYRFHSGEALLPTELERVLAGPRPSIIVPLGDIEAGKTTLIALMYQRLCSRSMDQWRYSGSATSVGFARRSFLASIRSKRATPTTPRTSRAESGHYLHLDARSVLTDRMHRLVLADVSGEHVGWLCDGKVDPAVSEPVGRADLIPVVVAGAVLADPAQRSAQMLRTRTMLGMLGTHLRPTAAFSVVVTMLDRLNGLDAVALGREIVAGTIADGAPVFATAARSGAGGIVAGSGVDDLFTYLADQPKDPIGGSPVEAGGVSRIVERFWRAR